MTTKGPATHLSTPVLRGLHQKLSLGYVWIHTHAPAATGDGQIPFQTCRTFVLLKRQPGAWQETQVQSRSQHHHFGGKAQITTASSRKVSGCIYIHTHLPFLSKLHISVLFSQCLRICFTQCDSHCRISFLIKKIFLAP